MNERIRELVKQSGGEFWQRIESDDVLNKEAYITFDPPQSLEKFAELIVEECLDTIQRTNDGLGSHDPARVEAGRSVLTWAYHNIQHRFKMGRYKDDEHTGVEE